MDAIVRYCQCWNSQSMTMVVQKLMAITFCLLYFSDIVTGVQYLMGMVTPAQRQLGADIIVAGGGESGSLPLSPRFLERPGREEGCDGRRGGCKRAVNGVWTKKRG